MNKQQFELNTEQFGVNKEQFGVNKEQFNLYKEQFGVYKEQCGTVNYGINHIGWRSVWYNLLFKSTMVLSIIWFIVSSDNFNLSV